MTAFGKMRSYLDMLERGVCVLASASTFTHFQSVFSLSVGIRAEAAGPDAEWAGLQEAITLNWLQWSQSWKRPRAAVGSTHCQCQMRELNIRLKFRYSAFNWRIQPEICWSECRQRFALPCTSLVPQETYKENQVQFSFCYKCECGCCLIHSYFLLVHWIFETRCCLLHPFIQLCHLTWIMAYYML